MRPGWTTPFLDGTGWKGTDALKARMEGWVLEIGSLGMAVRDYEIPSAEPVVGKVSGVGYVTNTSGTYFNLRNYQPASLPEPFTHLLERAMTGDELSFKALYLMVFNDPEQYGEWRPTVEALKETYGG